MEETVEFKSTKVNQILLVESCPRHHPHKPQPYKRGIDILALCPFCRGEPESMDHALIKCPRAKLIWNRISPSPLINLDFDSNFWGRWTAISSSSQTEDLNIFGISC